MPYYFLLSYAKCPYYLVLYMQSVLVIKCFICKVSLSSALYAKCPYYLVLYSTMQSALIIIWWFVCKVGADGPARAASPL